MDDTMAVAHSCNTLPGILRAAIRDSGRPMLSIATEAGVSPGIVSRFVRGRRDLQLETAQKLAAVLRLELVPAREKAIAGVKGDG